MKGKAIVLIGYMGCGKTTVSKILAEKTGRLLLDTDERIEHEQGMSISRIFEEKGEQAFRQMETELLEQLVNTGFDGILSCGGGMPLKEENRRLMKDAGTVVYLKADAEAIATRLKDDESRPLLRGLDYAEKVKKIRDMLASRERSYEAAADQVTDTAGMSSAEVASCILACIHI
ncbi:MAG: shikimate kinase [Lachnospiraceae bacterium]|nr:shikimate kinase [Lachnospiraceae bacterium]